MHILRIILKIKVAFSASCGIMRFMKRLLLILLSVFLVGCVQHPVVISNAGEVDNSSAITNLENMKVTYNGLNTDFKIEKDYIEIYLYKNAPAFEHVFFSAITDKFNSIKIKLTDSLSDPGDNYDFCIIAYNGNEVMQVYSYEQDGVKDFSQAQQFTFDKQADKIQLYFSSRECTNNRTVKISLIDIN